MHFAFQINITHIEVAVTGETLGPNGQHLHACRYISSSSRLGLVDEVLLTTSRPQK